MSCTIFGAHDNSKFTLPFLPLYEIHAYLLLIDGLLFICCLFNTVDRILLHIKINIRKWLLYIYISFCLYVQVQHRANYNKIIYRISMMLCKVSYQGQNKIIKLQQTDQLQDLILQVPKFFPNPANFELYYLDEDQDQISMTIEEDFEIFKEKKKPNYKLYLRKRNYLMSESQIKPAEHSRKTDYASPQKHSPHKIIEQSEEEPLIYESKVRQFSNRQFESEKGLFSKSRKRQQVHDINCSKCRANQIVGVRYQCPFCLGFNICEVCERQDDHMHSLVKVKKTSKEINYEELRNHLNLEFPDQEILSKEKQLQELRRKCNNLEKKSSQTNVNQQINRTHRSSSSYNKSNERQPYQQSFDYRMRQGRRKADQMRKQIDKKFNRQYLIPNEGYGSYYDSRVPLQLELQRRKRLLYPNLNFDRY